jgi:hypothetical protein
MTKREALLVASMWGLAGYAVALALTDLNARNGALAGCCALTALTAGNAIHLMTRWRRFYYHASGEADRLRLTLQALVLIRQKALEHKGRNN